MPIAAENINEMRAALKKIDLSVFKLTEIFFIDCPVKDIAHDIILKIQQYIVQMSMLIPETRVYLDLIETGLVEDVSFVNNKFRILEDYIRKTDTDCEELLKELGL